MSCGHLKLQSSCVGRHGGVDEYCQNPGAGLSRGAHAPLCTPLACSSRERAFWMYLTDEAGEVVGLQAFRYDEIDTHLADWCVDLHDRRLHAAAGADGAVIPPKPPEGSVSERLTGKLVYHGEIWISKSIKSRKVFEALCPPRSDRCRHEVEDLTRFGAWQAPKWRATGILRASAIPFSSVASCAGNGLPKVLILSNISSPSELPSLEGMIEEMMATASWIFKLVPTQKSPELAFATRLKVQEE